jgi:hypothetical protein
MAKMRNKIETALNKLSSLEHNMSRMDDITRAMAELAKQVELSRPPTEKERLAALADKSYPFSVTMDDLEREGMPKTQTDLENSKMNLIDTIFHDYNETNIKNSFGMPNNPHKYQY